MIRPGYQCAGCVIAGNHVRVTFDSADAHDETQWRRITPETQRRITPETQRRITPETPTYTNGYRHLQLLILLFVMLALSLAS